MLRQVETCLRLCVDKYGMPAAHNEICMVRRLNGLYIQRLVAYVFSSSHCKCKLVQIQQTYDVLSQLGLESQVQEHAELWKLVGTYVHKSNKSQAFKEVAAPSVLQHSVTACIRKLHSSNWFPPCTTVQVRALPQS